MKLCIIYNYAQHYRKEIFQLLDQEFDCDWFFGDSMGDVKKLDYSVLKGNINEIHTSRFGRFIIQKGLRRLLKQYRVFLVIGEPWNLSIWRMCIESKFFKKCNIYFWTHGWYGKESIIEARIKLLFYNMATGVFLYGNYAKDLMIKEGFLPAKLHVIYNSLDYSYQVNVRAQLESIPIYKNHFHNDYPNLIFVGRLTRVKKLDMVLKAMAISMTKKRLYNMTFIGDGEVKNELETLAALLGLSDRVWFYGPSYDEKELGALVYNADLCVSPGNIGLTAMHSMVFGTPAITHNCFKYQMPEFEAIKDGITGTFYKINDVNSLSDRIDWWFKTNEGAREKIRIDCMHEIDSCWNPQNQINIFKQFIK